MMNIIYFINGLLLMFILLTTVFLFAKEAVNDLLEKRKDYERLKKEERKSFSRKNKSKNNRSS